MTDKKMDLPAWMDSKNDEEHQQSIASMSMHENDDDDEGQPLLFGTGSIPQEKAPAVEDYGTTNALGDDDDEVDEEIGPDAVDDEEEEELKEEKKTSGKAKKKKSKQKRIEVRDSDEISALSGGAPTSRPHIPMQNPLLYLFHLINGAAIIASFCLLMTQIIPFVLGQESVDTFFSTLNLFLKFYITLFCIAFLLVETDVPLPMLRNSIIFQSYMTRGFLYSFLGLVSTVESYSDRVQSFLGKSGNDNITWAAIFMQVSAWLMLAVGLVYFCMGLLCLQPIVQRMKEDEREQWREYRIALKEWKKRQEEKSKD